MRPIYDWDSLAEQLADMSRTAIAQLRAAAIDKREQDRLARDAARLSDPAGTVRYDKAETTLLVRTVEDEDEDVDPAWIPFIDVSSGIYVEDQYVRDNDCPIIGQIPS